MKYKTTQKAIQQNYQYVIKIGYCNLQYSLNYMQPIAYTARMEGWASDVYDCGDLGFPNVAISTGYAPFGNVVPSYGLCEKYNNEGRFIRENYPSYFERKENIEVSLQKFIQEALNENNARNK